MCAQDPGDAVEARIRASIRAQLPSGAVRKRLIAHELGLSPRSLDRVLARRGSCFRALLDEVRHDLAERLLAGTGLKLAEISRRLGYSDPANFTRAFYRWTGRSPRSFRLRSGAR